MTAPTGIAALQVGGSTIHSWSGLGYAREGVDHLLPLIIGGKLPDGKEVPKM